MSVAVGVDDVWLYRHDASIRRAPASNEKLVLSMALLQSFGADYLLPIQARAETDPNGQGVLSGPLWLVGSGDPEVGANDIGLLAKRIEDAGVTKVVGRVLGATRPFAHDWHAPGWKSSFDELYVPLPTALSFEGNVDGGRHIDNPEVRAAQALTKELRAQGVAVTGRPGDGIPPTTPVQIASVESKELSVIMRDMNVPSSNFHAETLGKLLGWADAGPPGTIAKGAAAIEAFAADATGALIVANDASGLSYQDRIAPQQMVELLWYAQDQPWENDLRGTLPKPGQGTLAGRLGGITVRAKTGTLDIASALSGWVWLEQRDRWAAFSIISHGLPKDEASRFEDAIVRTLSERAT